MSFCLLYGIYKRIDNVLVGLGSVTWMGGSAQMIVGVVSVGEGNTRCVIVLDVVRGLIVNGTGYRTR